MEALGQEKQAAQTGSFVKFGGMNQYLAVSVLS
jgi:hypothetical protein